MLQGRWSKRGASLESRFGWEVPAGPAAGSAEQSIRSLLEIVCQIGRWVAVGCGDFSVGPTARPRDVPDWSKPTPLLAERCTYVATKHYFHHRLALNRRIMLRLAVSLPVCTPSGQIQPNFWQAFPGPSEHVLYTPLGRCPANVMHCTGLPQAPRTEHWHTGEEWPQDPSEQPLCPDQATLSLEASVPLDITPLAGQLQPHVHT